MSKTRKTFLTCLAAGVLLLGADIYSSTAELLPVANAETVRTTRKTRVRARPGEKSRTLTRVDSGEKLKVLARQGRWIKVRANGRTGWITRTSAASTRQARRPVRKTRRRAFVEGRSKRRGWSGSAPDDRVGADATDEEVIEEDRVAARDRRDRRDRDEEVFEEDGIEEEMPEPVFVEVSVKETEILSEPTMRGKNVAWADKGDELEVIDEDGDWVLVLNDMGEEGWVRSDDVSEAGYTYDKKTKWGFASLGYTSYGSQFASDDTMSELGNYKISTAAASLRVGGTYLHKYSDKYILGGDGHYIGTRASPGIRYVDADGNAADISFTQHEVNLGASVGYNLKSKRGTVAYARLGYYYSQFSVDNVGDFEQNLAYLPSEILQGITVGARVHMPRLTDKIGAVISLDALYPNGSRTQTQGLEDGAVSSVFAAWGVAHLSYQWKSNMTIDGIYRYSYAKTDWQGAAEESMRPHNATTAARKDVGHTAMIGIGRDF